MQVGVRPSLPVKGITFILGNDLAGGKVMPMLEVADAPNMCFPSVGLSRDYPEVFSACIITRAQSKKNINYVDLADTFIVQILVGEEITKAKSEKKSSLKGLESVLDDPNFFKLPVTREIIASQKKDQTLNKCFSNVVRSETAENSINPSNTAYFVDA